MREREIGLPFTNPFSKCFQESGLSQVKARNWQLNPISPVRWQELNYLSHHLLAPKMSIKKKMGQAQNMDLNMGSLMRNVSTPMAS